VRDFRRSLERGKQAMDEELADLYYDGAAAGLRAALASRAPRAAPWQEYAPEWARSCTGHRAYHWLRGFMAAWNARARQLNWPEWAHLRLTFRRGQP